MISRSNFFACWSIALLSSDKRAFYSVASLYSSNNNTSDGISCGSFTIKHWSVLSACYWSVFLLAIFVRRALFCSCRSCPRKKGVAGSLVDAVARSAGLDSMGRSFISEYEINFRPQLSSDELIATAVVDSHNHLYMTYSCEIYQFENSEKRLVIESQGTLNKARPQDAWTSRKVIHELGVC